MPKRQSKKQSREIGNIGYIRRRKTKQKQRASYKQLDDKDEPNIASMRKSQQEPSTQRHTTGQHKKSKMMSNTDPQRKRGWMQVLTKD